jgi:hypothetical protein
METQELVESRREVLREEVARTLRNMLMRLLRRHFGTEVDNEIERRVAMASADQTELWAVWVLSGTALAEIPMLRSELQTERSSDLVVTTELFEKYRSELFQEGFAEGLRQCGAEQGERKMLLRLLRRRFGSQIDGEIERRVAAASIEQIELWADRVLSAATLAEILAD